MYVCMYVYMYVRTYVGMYVCMYMCMSVYVRMYVCKYVCIYVCMCVLNVGMYVCTLVCVCACIYVYLYLRSSSSIGCKADSRKTIDRMFLLRYDCHYCHSCDQSRKCLVTNSFDIIPSYTTGHKQQRKSISLCNNFGHCIEFQFWIELRGYSVDSATIPPCVTVSTGVKASG
jgi:nuclear pore complex protein Nup62